jgi:ParB family transcriptional regulator, chromosome partitioning protein
MKTLIPFSKLSISPNNVRVSNGNEGVESLAANIEAHGIIQDLIVGPAPKKGYYHVYDGGRRLRAIAMLVEQNQLPKTFQLPCDVREEDAQAQKDISLSLNTMRVAMTAADECKAFTQLITADVDEDEIAKRYGCDVRHVRARLRLGNLAPVIFGALAAGEIHIETAKAYGLTADHQKQEAIWNALKENGNNENSNAVRRAMLDSGITSISPIALLVGEEAYVAAGGRIETDLFSDKHGNHWLDGHIATSLAEAKMAELAELAKTENGLGWIQTTLSTYVDYDETSKFAYYPRPKVKLTEKEEAQANALREKISTIQTKFDEIGEDDNEAETRLQKEFEAAHSKLEALTNRQGPVPEDEREFVGTFMMLNSQGKPEFHNNLLTSKLPVRSNARETVTTAEDGTVTITKPDHSQKLVEELSITRRDILALYIANDRAMALDLAIFKMALGQLSNDGGNRTGLSLAIRSNDDPRQGTAAPETEAAKLREKMFEDLDTSWFKERDEIASFDAFRTIDEGQKAQWLAYAMSAGIKASLNESGRFQNTFHDHLGTIMDIDIAQHWRPTKDNYFGSIRRDTVLKVIGTLGDASLTSRYASAKKGELSETAEKIFSGKTILDPETKQAATSWVPSELRFAPPQAVEEPVTAEDDEPTAEEQEVELAD